ncbi:MAG: endonuclease III domain-containing protein [Armatimonadota bacterium]
MKSNADNDNFDRIFRLLEDSYGSPVCKPEYNPLDELVHTILSQATSRANYTAAYKGLRNRFPTWEDVKDADVQDIEDSIRMGGLAKTKAIKIKQILHQINTEHGKLDIDFLADMSDHDAIEYLMGFDGVGIKTAACVLMFSLCRNVLPVDTHVHRICQRLSLISAAVSPEDAFYVLEGKCPPEKRYSFHINLVSHGRQVCKSQKPLCDICRLLPECSFGMRNMESGDL